MIALVKALIQTSRKFREGQFGLVDPAIQLRWPQGDARGWLAQGDARGWLAQGDARGWLALGDARGWLAQGDTGPGRAPGWMGGPCEPAPLAAG